MDGVVVRPVKYDEIPEMFRIFRSDWIDSVSTMIATFYYDNEGILVAVDSTGAIIGAVAGCRLSDTVGFIGYFVVKKELRGEGIGRILLDQCLHHLGSRNIGLNAIESAYDIYPKRGFNIPAFSGIINRGNLKKGSIIAGDLQRAFDSTGSTVQLHTEGYDGKLQGYDVTIHSVERGRFMRQWMTSSVTTVYVALCDDVIIGYGCIQILEPNVYYIGPVFADDPVTAEILLRNLVKDIPEGAELTMETLTTNQVARDIAKSFGLSGTSQYTRLYTHEEIKIPVQKVFALTTGAMGLI